VLLWHLFRGKTDGFYIEVGAYDGYTYAVTYAFECMGWTGLLVEPIPERHAACQSLRKWSRVEHAALSKRGSSGTATFAHITSSKHDYEASSFLPGSVTKKRFMRPPRSKKGGTTQSITVPLTTMDNLLKDYPGTVDFMVLDVEGAEMNLLDGFDVDRYKPAVMVVEDQAMGADGTLLEYLEGKGYRHIMWLSYNRVLIRRDRPELIERAAQVAQAGHKGVTL
ncbi:MAG: FkbM family methyltransferase, partial [Phycisphaerales bacterium]